ncbi:hypothetical protein MO973_10330 [Paenibacillus sp. TRM 82003]|nr:hypothetical protein [Paenibacillus sp. TRM 82003]
MKLTDEDFFLLNVLIELYIPADDREESVGRIAERLASGAERTESEQRLLRRVRERPSIAELALRRRRTFGEAEAYAFERAGGSRVVLFLDRSEAWLERLRSLIDGTREPVWSLERFLAQERGDGACFVSGYAIGGAYAILASASASAAEGDVAGGVVFDPPGLGGSMSPAMREHVRVRGVLSPRSVLSAVGSHPEPTSFADVDGIAAGRLPRYRFDDAGGAAAGEPGAMHQLFERLHALARDGNGEAFNEAVAAFAEVSGPEPGALGDDCGWLLLCEPMERSVVQGALTRIGDGFRRRTNELFRAWERSVGGWREGAWSVDELEDAMLLRTEELMDRSGRIAEEMNQGAHAVLAAMTALSGKPSPDWLEDALTAFADRLEAGTEKLAVDIADGACRVADAHRNEPLPLPAWDWGASSTAIRSERS